MTAADRARHQEFEASLPYEAWEKMVAEYSSRAVTNPTDRIPAILGLGHRLEATLGDKFIAGVWKETFGLRSLCWQATHAGHPITHYPTWSWASITSPVQYSMLCTKDVRDGLVTWHASPPEYDVEAHRVQRIVRGSITIRGTTKPVIKDLVRSERFYGYSNGTSSYSAIEYFNQTFFDRDHETLVGAQYLIMASIKSHENRLPRVVCMLLKPVRGKENYWRHIGMCSLEDNEDFWVNLERDRVICII